jgi:hypothetical protein
MTDQQQTFELRGTEFPLEDLRTALDRIDQLHDGTITDEYVIEGPVAITGDSDPDKFIRVGFVDNLSIEPDGTTILSGEKVHLSLSTIKDRVPSTNENRTVPDATERWDNETVITLPNRGSSIGHDIELPAETTLDVLEQVDPSTQTPVIKNGVFASGDTRASSDWIRLGPVESLQQCADGSFERVGDYYHNTPSQLIAEIQDKVDKKDDFIDYLEDTLHPYNDYKQTDDGAIVKYGMFMTDEMQALDEDDGVAIGAASIVQDDTSERNVIRLHLVDTR